MYRHVFPIPLAALSMAAHSPQSMMIGFIMRQLQCYEVAYSQMVLTVFNTLRLCIIYHNDTAKYMYM